jgi:hypothetical protein
VGVPSWRSPNPEIAGAIATPQDGGKLVIDGEPIVSTVVSPELYAHRDFRPAWMSTEAIQQLVEAIHVSAENEAWPPSRKSAHVELRK